MYYKIFFFVILICMGKAIAQPIEQNYLFNPPPAQDPTYFNEIKPENVLVVYKRPNDETDTLGNISEEIKDYYVSKRGIPSINIVKGLDGDFGLPLPDIQYYNGESVVLAQDREIIKRNHPCADDGNNGICDTLAFYYYYEKIALPITNYLNNTIDPNTGNYLKDQIHYIVLCKGIPLKIKSADYGWVKYWKSYHIAIDGLLCLLKTNNNNNPSIMKLYPPTTNIYYGCMVENPYNGIDLDFNFNNRFKANHYFVNKVLNDNTSAQFKITCLVSRLDGRNQQEVIDLIDKSYTPDKSGEGTWILDGHYFYSWETEYYQNYNSYNQSTIVPTANKLSQYGFNVYCDGTSRSPIYSYSSPVAGYLSWGRHAGYPIGFVVDTLSFALRPGSVYNTLESYNGASMQSVYRVDEQSLLSEFIQNEGTSGVGHTYEPYLGPNNNPFNFFPAYAMGYNIVEAAYQGIEYLAWQNIVIGDPLTTIAWGKQTLTENKTLTGTNLVTGVITVPSGKTLTIAANAVINFKHNGSLIVNGTLVVQSGASLRFTNGAYLTINGTLNATGISTNKITFDRIGTTGSWGGIVFNSGSSGSVEYCNISHATNGITCSSTLPMIRYNTIANNATGIYVSNVGTPSNEISYNTIQSNTYQGISLYYASPKIYSNAINSNAYYGISCRYYSSPYLYGNTITGHPSSALSCYYYSSARLVPWNAYGYYWGAGRNKIKNNTGHGINASYWSNLYLGSSPYGGHNSICNNTGYELRAYYGCTITAEINWWGANPPNTNEFDIYQSTIDYAPADTTDWNPDNQSIVRGPNGISNSSTTNSVKSDLDKAYGLQSEGKFDEAIAVYDSYINANPTDSKSAYALVRIDECYKLSGREGAAIYLDNTIKTKANKNNEFDAVSLELKNHYLIQDKKFEEAVNNLNKLAVTYKTNKDVEKHSLFNAGYVYLKYLNDYKNATDKFDELAAKYPDDELVFESKYLLGNLDANNRQKLASPNISKSNLPVPTEYALDQNYPNPFNPATTISYQLPKSGSVTLKIFDILGNEVKTLVNEQKEMGRYTVQFDAGSLASGMYVYQLRVNDYTSTKKMLLLK
ncbi:MAG: TIGR03790 family protein [Ignavibacteriaceae bacterium]